MSAANSLNSWFADPGLTERIRALGLDRCDFPRLVASDVSHGDELRRHGTPVVLEDADVLRSNFSGDKASFLRAFGGDTVVLRDVRRMGSDSTHPEARTSSPIALRLRLASAHANVVPDLLSSWQSFLFSQFGSRPWYLPNSSFDTSWTRQDVQSFVGSWPSGESDHQVSARHRPIAFEDYAYDRLEQYFDLPPWLGQLGRQRCAAEAAAALSNPALM